MDSETFFVTPTLLSDSHMDASAQMTSRKLPASGQPLALSIPIMSREAFAAAVGLTPATIFSMTDRGLLPTVHYGRRVFINLEVLRSQCASKEFA